MIKDRSKLRLVGRDGKAKAQKTAAVPNLRAYLSDIFAELDAMPRGECVKNLNNLGATLPSNPTDDAIGSAWESITDRLSVMLRIEAHAGTTDPEEVMGVVHAALDALEAVPKLQAQEAELERGLAPANLERLLKDPKVSPEQRTRIRAAFAAGDLGIKGAESWIKHLPAKINAAPRQGS